MPARGGRINRAASSVPTEAAGFAVQYVGSEAPGPRPLVRRGLKMVNLAVDSEIGFDLYTGHRRRR
jgi:hypothetical protein